MEVLGQSSARVRNGPKEEGAGEQGKKGASKGKPDR